MELLKDTATRLKGTKIASFSFIREGASISLLLIETQRMPTEPLSSRREDSEMSHKFLH